MRNRTLAFSLVPLLAIAISACSSDDDDSDSNGNGAGNGAGDTPIAVVSLFDESVSGEITDDPNNPLPLQLEPGENQFGASVVAGDIDYITINVPANMVLSAINLDSYESLDDQSFMGLQSGSVFTELPAEPNVANLLGFSLFGTASVGTDLLPNIAAGQGAIGFTPPLQAGDYSFWIQETGEDVSSFSVTFVVTDADAVVADNTPVVAALFGEDEGGEISDDPNNPLPLQLAIGDNLISASVIEGDLDYVTINVPANSRLSAITVNSYDSSQSRSFVAIQNGSVFTELVDSPNVGNLLGYAHFGAADIGGDILPNIAEGAGALGFAPPLQAGDYSLWMQETSSAQVDFSITFEVTANQ